MDREKNGGRIKEELRRRVWFRNGDDVLLFCGKYVDGVLERG